MYIHKVNNDIAAFIDEETAKEIVKTKQPRGKFYYTDRGWYTGIDNVEGKAWKKTFIDKNACLKWVLDEDIDAKKAESIFDNEENIPKKRSKVSIIIKLLYAVIIAYFGFAQVKYCPHNVIMGWIVFLAVSSILVDKVETK